MFSIWRSGFAPAQLVLARDRLGKKPLYYSVRLRVVFGSELRRSSPMAGSHGSWIRKPWSSTSPASTFAPATILREVRKLPAAHLAVLDEHGFRIRRYWDVPAPSRERISAREAARSCCACSIKRWRSASSRTCRSGCFLSGGVDSTSIAALAVRHKNPLQDVLHRLRGGASTNRLGRGWLPTAWALST